MSNLDFTLSSIDLVGVYSFEFYTDSKYYYTVKQGQKKIELSSLTNCTPSNAVTLEVTFSSNSTLLDLSGKTAISFSKVNSTILIFANSDSYVGDYVLNIKAY